MDSAQELVRAALLGRLPSLTGLPADPGTAAWRSLVLLDEQLPPSSSRSARVQGMRRHNFYSTQIASSLAATLCEQMADAHPLVFGDLSLAISHYGRAGDRPVDYLAIRVDRHTATDRLEKALSALPGSAGLVTNRQVARATVKGLSIGLHRSWPVLMAANSEPLQVQGRVVDTPAGTYTVASDAVETLRILCTAHQTPDDLCWVLDLAAIAPSPRAFEQVADLARRTHRGASVTASWTVAYQFGIAPKPPTLPDPLSARLGQRLALSSWRYPRALGNRLLRFA